VSRDASVTFEWGDGETTFRLAWAQWEKLQEVRDCGPYVLLERLHSGGWRIEDIREIIRWGLIGGGKKPEEASKLIRLYVEGFPPADNLEAAQKIARIGTFGAQDETLGETEAPNLGENGSTVSQTAK
jgi:hypothetical protein